MTADTLALMVGFARAGMLAERAWWGANREVPHNTVERMACAEKQELLGSIDAGNAVNSGLNAAAPQ